MKKSIRRYITNVFANNDYHCFACSPTNKIGLQLQFFEEEDYVKAEWKPSKEYEGYPGSIHGGIQSTLLDEIGAWTLYIKGKTSGVTSRLHVRYKKTLSSLQASVLVRGKIVEIKRNLAYIFGEIINEAGEVCAEAEMVYFMFPQKESIEKGWYPEDYNDFFKLKK